ncbi:MAG: ParB N-terminal domain-containing protein [Xanthobacteraceae bacterium]
MMKRETFPISKIYVPAKRRGTLDPKKAQEIAESILQVGQQVPILVRQDGARLVLVEGLHRLEACRQLGEETILGYLVQARRH